MKKWSIIYWLLVSKLKECFFLELVKKNGCCLVVSGFRFSYEGDINDGGPKIQENTKEKSYQYQVIHEGFQKSY